MDNHVGGGSLFEVALPEHLRKVVGDPSELNAFRHWFTRALWEAESTASDDILSLAFAIENSLGILDAGMWTEGDLLAALGEHLAALDAATKRRQLRVPT